MKIQENVKLAPLTTFEIGGEARYFVSVRGEGELREALRYAKEKNLPFFVLAGGSNVLVSDKGFSGLVIHMENKDLACDGEMLIVGAGLPLLEMLRFAARRGLRGMEHLSGIPGTVGGAMRGNAGAFGVEMKDFVMKVRALCVETLQAKEFNNTQCHFSYRESFFKKTKNYIIISVTLKFVRGDVSEGKQIMEDIIAQRESRQIQNIKSAGSFFMNPVVKDVSLRETYERENKTRSRENRVPAGWLMDEAGLKGKSIGGITMGHMHSNYFINFNNGTAEEVIILASIAKQKVRKEFAVQLREEVTLIGFD